MRFVQEADGAAGIIMVLTLLVLLYGIDMRRGGQMTAVCEYSHKPLHRLNEQSNNVYRVVKERVKINVN